MKTYRCFVILVLALMVSLGLMAQGKQKTPPKENMKFDTAPVILHAEQPYYPDLAVRAGKEGTVYVKMWVDEEGNVGETSVTKSEDEIFNLPALDAAKKYQFSPAKVGDKSIATWVTIPFKFRLKKDELKGTQPSARGANPGIEIDKKNKVDKEVEILYSIPASYPPDAKKEGAQGEAFVQVYVDESGSGVQVKVLKTDRKDFGEAAAAAVSKWKFKPAMKDNKPVATWVTVPFKFKLGDKKEKQD